MSILTRFILNHTCCTCRRFAWWLRRYKQGAYNAPTCASCIKRSEENLKRNTPE